MFEATTTTTRSVKRNCTSARRTSRRAANVWRAKKLRAKSRPTTCSNIFRWYRSSFGRYTQPDPLGLITGPNLFAYVHNAPENLKDRLGLGPIGDAFSCCKYMYLCAKEGTACRDNLEKKIAQLDEEELYELFEAEKVSSESAYLKKKCFDENVNCKLFEKKCVTVAVDPGVSPTGADGLPVDEPWWGKWLKKLYPKMSR